jgi:hypothetical protein
MSASASAVTDTAGEDSLVAELAPAPLTNLLLEPNAGMVIFTTVSIHYPDQGTYC